MKFNPCGVTPEDLVGLELSLEEHKQLRPLRRPVDPLATVQLPGLQPRVRAMSGNPGTTRFQALIQVAFC